MQIEFEATFTNVDKNQMRETLRKAGAALVRPEFLQKRVVFNLPSERHATTTWLRVRDEGDQITMSLKVVDGDRIEDQKEICLHVDSFQHAVDLLNAIGCRQKAYQESRRELWKLGDAEITIDEWPFLEPFVEVEGLSEEVVKRVSEKLGFDWARAKFCAVGTLYSEKYGMNLDEINNEVSRIVFGEKNPFIKNKQV